MRLEKYGDYGFIIYDDAITTFGNDGYYYMLYHDYNSDAKIEIIKSHEYFETEQEARFAAIGHISLLQQKGVKDAK